MALLQAAYLLAQGRLRLDQCLPPALLPVQRVQRLQLDVEREEGLARFAKRVELGTGRFDALELALHPIGIAMQRRLSFFGDVDLRQKLPGLIPLPLNHLPPRLDRHHLAVAHRPTMRRLLGSRFSLLLARRSLGQRPQDRFGIGHPALHPFDRRPDPIALLAREILGDAQLLVAEHP